MRPSPRSPAARPLHLAYRNPSPPNALPIDNGTLGMALFLTTEMMLFAGLVSALLVLRAGAPAWPPADQPRLPAGITAINTAVLLASAWTMARASSRRGRASIRWLVITAVLGAAFVAAQGVEWLALLRYGLRAADSLYAATFYAIIGCHGLHVAIAVGAVSLLAVRAAFARRRRRVPPRLAPYRLYWFFVAGIWPVLYVLVYLS